MDLEDHITKCHKKNSDVLVGKFFLVISKLDLMLSIVSFSTFFKLFYFYMKLTQFGIGLSDQCHGCNSGSMATDLQQSGPK